MKIYVTLISEQAVPNVQYIKELGPFDSYVFLSTEKMEGKEKSNNIRLALKIPENVLKIIIVSEEDYSDILTKLNQSFEIKETDSYTVNCTLGTKIMSIALFSFFKDIPNATILYSPIGTNRYKSIIGRMNAEFISKLDLNEYFQAYGIEIKKSSKPLLSYEITEQMRQVFLEFEYRDYEMLDKLRDYRSARNVPDYLLEHFRNLVPNIPEVEPERHLVRYLTGGWFEEYCYYHLKEKFILGDDQIGLGVEVSLETTNDLDVVFLYRNNLYVIECKTTLGKDIQQETLYKSGALIDKFGRAAQSALMTMQDLRDNQTGELMDSVALRARQQNIKVFDRKDMMDFNSIKL